MRIPRLKREAAAVCIMRKTGVAINQIASFLGRSHSFIYRILRFNGLAHRIDLRKLPWRIRSLSAARIARHMEILRHRWEMWILGEGEKPP